MPFARKGFAVPSGVPSGVPSAVNSGVNSGVNDSPRLPFIRKGFAVNSGVNAAVNGIGLAGIYRQTFCPHFTPKLFHVRKIPPQHPSTLRVKKRAGCGMQGVAGALKSSTPVSYHSHRYIPSPYIEYPATHKPSRVRASVSFSSGFGVSSEPRGYRWRVSFL